MKSAFVLLAAAAQTVSAAVSGFDISHWQGNVNFAGAYASGARFVIIKVIPRSLLSFIYMCSILAVVDTILDDLFAWFFLHCHLLTSDVCSALVQFSFYHKP
jgi:hypothetical protein